MIKRVLLTQPINPAGIKIITDAGFDVVIADKTDEDYLVQKVKDFDAIIVRSSPLTGRTIKAAEKCIVIGKHGVGFDNIDVKTATDCKIPVVYAPGSNSNAVAEHTVAIMLALAKHLWEGNVQLRNYGNYNYRLKVIASELKDKTLGLVGLGNIGRRVATICQKGFGMKIIGIDPYISSELLEKEGLEVELVEDLDYLLKNSDIVSLHMPGMKDKKNLIGERELSIMKKTAFLVNTARGILVDENALYEALKSGKIAGAGLDVFDPEPPSPDNPLFKLENVVVTPHYAAHTEEGNRNMAVMVTKNVVTVLKGEKPKNLANPEIWEERRMF